MVELIITQVITIKSTVLCRDPGKESYGRQWFMEETIIYLVTFIFICPSRTISRPWIIFLVLLKPSVGCALLFMGGMSYRGL